MSAVQFTCPVDGCGFRGFDEPPTTKMICRHHNQRLVQDEVYTAGDEADYRFREVVSISERGQVKTAPKDALSNDPEAVEKLALRTEYEVLTGVKADRRWNIDTLRNNVEYARNAQEETV